MREVPSLYGQAVAHVLKNKQKYEDRLHLLPTDIQETVNNLSQQPGYLYVTRGFAEEYIQENLKPEDKMRDVWRAVDLAFYQSKQRKKRFQDYPFSTETIELAEKLKKHWNNLETLKEIIERIDKYQCFNDFAAAQTFKHNLTDVLLYITPIVQRKKLTQELWEQAGYQGHISTLKLLLKQGFKVNRRDAQGKTALGNACQTCQYNAIRFLIEEMGARLNILNDVGNHVLTRVEWYGGPREEIEQLRTYLIEKGADPQYEQSKIINKDLLKQAIATQNVQEVCRLLTSDICIPSYADWEIGEEGPLTFAAKKGNKELVETLLSQKRFYLFANDDISKAYKAAVMSNYPLCAALIRDYQRIKELKEKRKEKEKNIKYSFDFIENNPLKPRELYSIPLSLIKKRKHMARRA